MSVITCEPTSNVPTQPRSTQVQGFISRRTDLRPISRSRPETANTGLVVIWSVLKVCCRAEPRRMPVARKPRKAECGELPVPDPPSFKFVRAQRSRWRG